MLKDLLLKALSKSVATGSFSRMDKIKEIGREKGIEILEDNLNIRKTMLETRA